MPKIRPYQPKDAENVRHICIVTGPRRALQPGPAQTMLLATYADYYMEREPQNCFVAADEQDEAVGYIICAEEYWGYREAFLRDYAPRTRGLGPVLRTECLGAAVLPRLFERNYPAHLHINLLPGYQRMGLGHQLMDTLTAHLREKGISGVMLGVGADNVKGRSFYQKYGFHRLLRIPGCVVMGYSLSPERL